MQIVFLNQKVLNHNRTSLWYCLSTKKYQAYFLPDLFSGMSSVTLTTSVYYLSYYTAEETFYDSSVTNSEVLSCLHEHR